jgi:hypothetical protein
MKTYAVCELEEHLNEILRLVQVKKEVIEITSCMQTQKGRTASHGF